MIPGAPQNKRNPLLERPSNPDLDIVYSKNGNKRLVHPQEMPALHHFAVKRKMGFTGATVFCWCGGSIEMQGESTRQLNDFMVEHDECRPMSKTA